MTIDKINVTVDGPPVMREVSLDDVRAYLRRTGWRQTADRPVEWWHKGANVALLGPLEGPLKIIASEEQRHPSAVLVDIARGAKAGGAELLSAVDLTRMERDGVDVTPEVVLRLLATVRAREKSLRDMTADRDYLKRREADIIEACERVADGGQYRNDIVSAIQRIRRERDEAQAAHERVIVLATSWRTEAANYDAIARDLVDGEQKQRYLGRAKQCRTCAAALLRALGIDDTCPECGEAEHCELTCPSRARFAEVMTSLCLSDDPDEQAMFHDALEMLGAAEAR